MNKKNLSLMDDIMFVGLARTDEWNDILLHDPMIAAADARWRAALEKAKAFLPTEIYMELDAANADEVIANGDAGILFGIRVADAIRDAVARPADLSRHILERIGEEVTA